MTPILSREKLLDYSENKEAYAIGISSVEALHIETIKENMGDRFLHLVFDDIVRLREGFQAVTLGQVETALEWAKDKPNLAVGCSQGVSRSSAIAYLIECQKSDPVTALQCLDYKKHSPNLRVIQCGAKILNNRQIITLIDEFYDKVKELRYK